jgi:hypothetical protein
MSDALHNHMPRARGRERDIKTAAYRRFVDDERPIVAVTRARLDVVYINHGHRPRSIFISLARVAGYFEQEPFKEQGS